MKKKPYFAYRSFWKEFDAKKRFREVGVNQYCVFAAHSNNSLGEPYCQYPPTWLWFDAYDFAPFDEQVEDLLAIHPEPEILCMVDLNSPVWLARQLGCRKVSSDSFAALTDALAAECWFEATQKYMEALIRHAEEKYGQLIQCYILACGATDEWMDYSGGRETREKLERYRAWNRERGEAEPDCIPSLNRRFHAPHPGGLRDPETDREAVRYWRFLSELVAGSILRFAAAAKALIPAEREVGVFYGYILELKLGLVQCGHLAYEKVLASQAVDFVISPGSYSDRQMGGGGGFMTPNGTVHRFGKGCLHELDHRTHTANMQLTPNVRLPWMTAWPDERADIAGLRREFGRSLCHGTSVWWFDMWGKFFDSDRVMAEIGRFGKLWEEFADRDTEPLAEVAVIVDPDSMLYVDDSGKEGISSRIYEPLIAACNRLGAPYRVFSFNDLPEVDWSGCKLAIFPALFEVTEEKRALLERHILTGGRSVLWLFGAALSDGRSWSEAGMRDLTGFDFGAPAGVSERDSWRSFYRPEYNITAAELKVIASAAGIHLYTDAELPVWVTEKLLMVHSAESGPITIRLPEKRSRIRERFDERFELAEAAEFTYIFKGPETILLELT